MLRKWFRRLGPGIAVAATGVGAGDIITAAVAGSKYGYALIWAVLVGALLKYSLNEGLARWQLATGTTLLEGWVNHLGIWVRYFFLIYLVIWSWVVGGAMISACGIAAHALLPQIGVNAWGIIQSLLVAIAVFFGSYRAFEGTMKIFIALMFVTLVGSSFLLLDPFSFLAGVVTFQISPESIPYSLGVIGGVGGSLTLLSYGYWIREKGWKGTERMADVRWDLGLAYALTAVFGMAVLGLGSGIGDFGAGGTQGMIQLALKLETVTGPAGRWLFLVGLWGAVITSMFGVWQSVPYMFCDFVSLTRGKALESPERSWEYRLYLCYLALAPIPLLFFQKPVMIILVYSVVGALFMPFLAGTLLYLNSRGVWMGELRTGWKGNILLALALVLFAYLCLSSLISP